MKGYQLCMFPITEKVNRAVERVRMFRDVSFEKPIWLSTSKGKDSLVLEYIFSLADVNYEKHYSLTSVDIPEVVQMAKNDKQCIIDYPVDSKGNPLSMWRLIEKKKFPPTRLFRYCCAELKERYGKGYITATGVRWEESINRKNNQGAFVLQNPTKKDFQYLDDYDETDKGGLILNLDNSDNRRFIEQCFRTRKTLLNPIIDFTDKDVWEIILSEHINYPTAYDNGYNRLGCIGCPLSGLYRYKEFKDYPVYKEHYINAFQKIVPYTRFNSGEEIFDWWLSI